MGCCWSKPKIVESTPTQPVVIEIPAVDQNPMMSKNESIVVESVSIDIVQDAVETVAKSLEIAKEVSQATAESSTHVVVAEAVQTVIESTKPEIETIRKSIVPTQIELYKESVGVIDKHLRPSVV
jgi:hypothetical protein